MGLRLVLNADDSVQGTVTTKEAAANKVWKNEDFAAQLQAAGGEAHIMVLKDCDHQATAKNGLSDAVLDWLFGK